MSLLTDEEIALAAMQVNPALDFKGFAEQIEAAVIKKLREQEPVGVFWYDEKDNEWGINIHDGAVLETGDSLYLHPAPQSEWQPIETAPEDSEFLVFMPKEKHPIQHAIWKKNMKVIGGHFHFDLEPATHWQPLPSPPEAK